jgi:hypothetical protein
MHDEQTLKWFDRKGIQRPTHLPHGVTDTPENPLSEQLERVKCSNWRIEGRKLIADTEHGPLVQWLPTTGYICHGTDKDGYPILTKVVT